MPRYTLAYSGHVPDGGLIFRTQLFSAENDTTAYVTGESLARKAEREQDLKKVWYSIIQKQGFWRHDNKLVTDKPLPELV